MICSGSWSGSLLAAALDDARWQDVLQPRKGHLLEVSPLEGSPCVLKNGLMEIGYAQVNNLFLVAGFYEPPHSAHDEFLEGKFEDN